MYTRKPVQAGTGFQLLGENVMTCPVALSICLTIQKQSLTHLGLTINSLSYADEI